MKTKAIPFKIETAKKIQAGEIEGKIRTKCGNKVRILCFDLIDPRDVSFPIVGAVYSDKYVRVIRFAESGRYAGTLNSELDLVLEVPDTDITEYKFKPFDKVLVRNPYISKLCIPINTWIPGIFQYKNNYNHLYFVSGQSYWECIPYEGNEYLVGTTDKPE